jgi:hypothetical protein
MAIDRIIYAITRCFIEILSILLASDAVDDDFKAWLLRSTMPFSSVSISFAASVCVASYTPFEQIPGLNEVIDGQIRTFKSREFLSQACKLSCSRQFIDHYFARYTHVEHSATNKKQLYWQLFIDQSLSNYTRIQALNFYDDIIGNNYPLLDILILVRIMICTDPSVVVKIASTLSLRLSKLHRILIALLCAHQINSIEPQEDQAVLSALLYLTSYESFPLLTLKFVCRNLDCCNRATTISFYNLAVAKPVVNLLVIPRSIQILFSRNFQNIEYHLAILSLGFCRILSLFAN